MARLYFYGHRVQSGMILATSAQSHVETSHAGFCRA